MNQPGPTALFGIPSRSTLRAKRYYNRLWARLRRQKLKFRLKQNRTNRRWKAKPGNRELCNAQTRAWKRANRDRVRQYARNYRREAEGYTCHFCGASGTKTRRLWPVGRLVEEHGQSVERRVRVCWWCRNVSEWTRRGKKGWQKTHA